MATTIIDTRARLIHFAREFFFIKGVLVFL
jgi:hypothetical protein